MFLMYTGLMTQLCRIILNGERTNNFHFIYLDKKIMKQNYKIVKDFSYRAFTEAELSETENGTALIIDDRTDGPIAIIPMKDKTYTEMHLSNAALKQHPVSRVIELRDASILKICIEVVYCDSYKRSTKKAGTFLDF